MKIIGITGGIACGKTTVTNYLKQKGYSVVDADEIVNHLLQTSAIQQEILQAFGTMDRKQIRAIVFKSEEKRKKLEDILHPSVIATLQKEVKKLKTGKDNSFVSIPLLFEKNLEKMFDATIAVICDEKDQLQRLQKRDQMDVSLSSSMIASQLTNDEKSSRATHTLNNNGSLEELYKKTDELLKKMS